VVLEPDSYNPGAYSLPAMSVPYYDENSPITFSINAGGLSVSATVITAGHPRITTPYPPAFYSISSGMTLDWGYTGIVPDEVLLSVNGNGGTIVTYMIQKIPGTTTHFLIPGGILPTPAPTDLLIAISASRHAALTGDMAYPSYFTVSNYDFLIATVLP
jgi:hypothetical protein